MKRVLLLALAGVPLILAQSPGPNILGAWKADLQRSKFSGPTPSQYLELIEEKTVVINRRKQEKAQETEELSGTWGEHGAERSLLSFVSSGKPIVRYYQGVPARITAQWTGNTLNLSAEVAGRPISVKREYDLASDGQTLKIDSTVAGFGPEQHNTIVLAKQQDAAASPLRQPEEKAGAHFKNVKTDQLKDLPVSEFIDNMRYFAYALGKDCQFCHVRNHFDSDDKREKKTARTMLAMNASINNDTFEGKPEVRCFTCHEFHEHPLSRPLFADEAERLRAEETRGPDGPMHGQGSGPGGDKPGEMPPGKPPQEP
jgi:hypothetical protein